MTDNAPPPTPDDSDFLRTLVLSTSHSTGTDFFNSLTQNLADALFEVENE
ncbi:MAG TPA: hypothetical protein VM008_04235 [Phycisphaerae bacterium]|nr:hypothetical protein [Phycisphaerae bacterium]